jgi:hypothetical protein
MLSKPRSCVFDDGRLSSARLHGPQARSPAVLAGAIGGVLGSLLLNTAVHAQQSPAAEPVAQAASAVPSFAELEAAGAKIGEIRIDPRNIFDLSDPQEDKWLFRWANQLHIKTRPGVIERSLLFKSGEPVSAQVMEETERLLRAERYLYDVQLRPVAYHDGVADVEVVTRDTWSLNLGANISRSGGTNSSGLQIKEFNLLGTGTEIRFGRDKNVDRSSSEFGFLQNHAFGSWTSVAYDHASNSDGKRDALAVVRPFYQLDARWTAGASASKDDRIESVYNAGNIVSQYRHQQELAQVFGGWSKGLVDGWVQRYTVGLSYQRDTYAAEPGRVAPASVPGDDKTVGPFVRYQLIEDKFNRELNRNLVGRPEYFQLGLASTVQLGLVSKGMGSDRNALTYAGSVSKGFETGIDTTLILAGSLSGEFNRDSGAQSHSVGARAQYYRPQGKRWLFYAAGAVDQASGGGLLLGGDNGLRGYPLRYQSGTRRALFTAEERFYTDVYLWRLFRVGGAAFVDVGRAWGGDNINKANPGWLSNVGFGLRFVSVRSAFGNVLHMDIAMPLNGTSDISKVQFLVKSKSSF